MRTSAESSAQTKKGESGNGKKNGTAFDFESQEDILGEG